MFRRSLLAALAAGAVLLTGCTGVSADVAAVVNGEEIPVSELERFVRQQLESPQFAELPEDQRVAQADTIQQTVLQGLIQNELLEGAIREAGITASAEEVEERWQTEIALQEGGEEALRALLEEIGLTEAEAREQLAARIRQEKFQASFDEQVEVSEDELRALYEERRDTYEQVTTAHILLETREEAQAVITLLEGGEDFNELAAARSIDPSAQANQGELGSFPITQLDPEYVEPLRDAEPGDIVGPVETQFGWHVIRFDGFETLSFEDVREDLEAELAGGQSEEGYRTFVTDLLERSKVEVNSRFGRWDATTASILPPETVGGGSGTA
ncbi:MAG: peptidylprolyl isomerase [Actinobacteria bacterium]|nr:peptidylprolyl isomerase [Actinomycetota bacterium]